MKRGKCSSRISCSRGTTVIELAVALFIALLVAPGLPAFTEKVIISPLGWADLALSGGTQGTGNGNEDTTQGTGGENGNEDTSGGFGG